MNLATSLQVKADARAVWAQWFAGLGIPTANMRTLTQLRAYLATHLVSDGLAVALDALCQEYDEQHYTSPTQLDDIVDSMQQARASRVNLDGDASPSTFRAFAGWLNVWAFETGTLAAELGSRYKVGMYEPRITDLTDVLTGVYGLEVSAPLAEETWTSLTNAALPDPSALYELVYGCVSPAQYLATEIESFGDAVSETAGAFGFFSNPGAAVQAADALTSAWTPD